MGNAAIHLNPVDEEEIDRAGGNDRVVASSGQPAPPKPYCQWLIEFLDRYRMAIWVAIGAMYVLGFNGQWLLQPDSALYLCLARNLARGRGYTFGGILHDTAC